MCILTYKTAIGDTPSYNLTNMIVPATTSGFRVRSNMRISLDVPKTLSRTGDLAFIVAAPRLWNTFNQQLYIISKLGYVIMRYTKYRCFQR